MVEFTDLIFAVDSIPAIFAITADPFLVFTSNVFAILGLRSLYFALAGMIDRFRYLKVSLAVVLMVVGVKMMIARLAEGAPRGEFQFLPARAGRPDPGRRGGRLPGQIAAGPTGDGVSRSAPELGVCGKYSFIFNGLQAAAEPVQLFKLTISDTPTKICSYRV